MYKKAGTENFKSFLPQLLIKNHKKIIPKPKGLDITWWAGMDSNHRTRMRTDLQSAAFSHSATYPYIFLR